VTAVFEDFPRNSDFSEIKLLMPWLFYQSTNALVKNDIGNWGSNDYGCYVQLKKDAEFSEVQTKIKDIMYKKVSEKELASKPDIILQPLSKRHLYDTFTNGQNTGGTIQLVWLFGLIGFFVLILACINFMNLSTARSEKRAKEIGVRKAIGSYRHQLVTQLLSESFLIVCIGFGLALLVVLVTLSGFNNLANKHITMPWSNPWFWWIAGISIVLTSLISGSYPAFYLSSFDPVRVLKGTFKVGKFSAIPRKVLVVVQFTVSIALIIGTLVVYRQIQFIKNRPMGYRSDGLIYLQKSTPELLKTDFDVIRNDLLATGVVEEACESSNAITSEGFLHTDIAWAGMPTASTMLFNIHYISYEYGKTMGFQLQEGRDFSRDYGLDNSSVIINESAAALMKSEDILNKNITKSGSPFQVIGIIKDVVEGSPFKETLPSVYFQKIGFDI